MKLPQKSKRSPIVWKALKRILGLASDKKGDFLFDPGLKTVLDALPAAISFIGKDRIYRFANTGYASWIENPSSEVVGKTLPEVLGPKAYERRKHYLEAAFEGSQVTFEDVTIDRSGKPRHTRITYQPHFGRDGEVVGIIVHLIDITEHKEIHERVVKTENTFEKIFEQSFSFMAILRGPDFIFEKTNEKYLDLIGQRNVLQKAVRDAVPEASSQGFFELLNRVYRTKKPYFGSEVPLVLQPRDGQKKKVYVDFIYQPLLDEKGTVDGIFVQGNDVTEKVQAREALEVSKKVIEVERENFRNLFRQTPEMVCILSGSEHIFEFVNESHVRVLGFNATGLTVRKAQPESVEIHGILDQVYQTGTAAELCEIPVTVGDRLRYFNLTFAARRDWDGKINGVMILGIEVTNDVLLRKTIQESQERYKLLFDESPIPKWIFDVETLRFVDVNRAASEVYGYTHQEFLSMKITDLRSDEDSAQLDKSLNTQQELERTYRIKGVRHRKKNGSWIFVEVSATNLMIEGRRLRLVAVVDVTERLLIEKQQKELLQYMERAKQEAEMANQLKSAFLANMSHEIRTPLSAMIGFADLLKDSTFSEQERGEFVEIMIRNGHQLTHIIDDILDLSKVESGYLKIESVPMELDKIASEVISLFQVKAREKKLELKMELAENLPKEIKTDPIRLKQILMNLLGNAVKFTEKGQVQMSVSIVSSEKIAFDIADTGIGIHEAERGKLFQMFTQADNTVTRKFGGTGLGLALSKRLAQGLGGDVILLKSEINQGSVFRVLISRDPSQPQVH